LRSPSIEEELNFLRANGRLYYELSGKPSRAEIGDYVYFIRNGLMMARSLITDLRWMDASELGATYTGVEITKSCHRFEIQDMELAKRPVPHKGFQGLRYITAPENRTFEAAFTKRP
jgi:hypothetical protein